VPPELIAFMSRAAPPAAAVGPMTIALRHIAGRIPRLSVQGGRISEQDTKRILITPAVEALGWDILDSDEVRNECRHNAADNPDYALFLNRSPVLFIEAKPLGHALDDRMSANRCAAPASLSATRTSSVKSSPRRRPPPL
jgi:hypothetical protein